MRVIGTQKWLIVVNVKFQNREFYTLSLFFVLKDGGTFPLFHEEWSAEEEVLLLDAIEQHGFGNWFVLPLF